MSHREEELDACDCQFAGACVVDAMRARATLSVQARSVLADVRGVYIEVYIC